MCASYILNILAHPILAMIWLLNDRHLLLRERDLRSIGCFVQCGLPISLASPSLRICGWDFAARTVQPIEETERAEVACSFGIEGLLVV